MFNRSRRSLIVSAAALSLFSLAPSPLASFVDDGPRDWPDGGPAKVAINVQASRLTSFDLRDRSHVRFGALEFRGGLMLSSSFKHFGGLSAFRINPDGKGFLALSDKGHWFSGEITYDGAAPSGLTKVEAAPMLLENGRTIGSRGWYDSESLARDGDTVYVGLERVHQILKFDFSRAGISSRGRTIPVPAQMTRLPANKGIESLVMAPTDSAQAGALVAISERGLDAKGNILGFLIGGPSPGQFMIRRTSGYDISDATVLRDHSLLLLERKFSLKDGIGVRIRRVPFDAIAPGAVIDGPTIFEADLGYEIDNFEGLDAFETPEGETVLTLISDDNFSFLQRTLLMQFTLISP
ncbi:MAG TPA: esterase-like activity of phytase family protein [Xanthobacteraceae bacterium]|nr:esterase-like activity of phytase family protein [Xanthobacteraceae bacterium]